MKKKNFQVLFILLIFNFLLGCQSLKSGLEGNKKSKSAEEFLIEKKSPLVLPPNFSKLPTPKNTNKNASSNSSESFNLEKVLKKKQNTNNELGESKSAQTLEKTILEKIKDN